MSLKLITPASVQAITTAEAKLHLKVDVADDDALIDAMIAAATEMVENKTGRALMTQTFELTLDKFPDAFELTRVPVQSVVSVKYRDLAGTLQTLAGSAYTMDNSDDTSSAYVVPAYDTEWPETRDQVNAVVVQYTAGYASAAAVPAAVKAWLKVMLTAMYDNRSAVGDEKTATLRFVDRLLDSTRILAL